MSWCPIFPQITDSSIWELPPHVFKAWINILTKKNHETHIWRGNEYTLAREAKITVPLAKEALGLLASPDPSSLSREHDGKRILSDDEEHWWVVNGQKYQDMIKREIALENGRQRSAKWRANLKAESSTGVSGVPESTQNAMAASSSYNAEPSNSRQVFIKPTLEELKLAMAKAGMPEFKAQAFLDHYETVGWVVGKGRLPMKNWRSAVGTWKSKWEEDGRPGAIVPATPKVMSAFEKAEADRRMLMEAQR